ncbi:hypothetical protein NC651_024249 [Populus alba x Populus x berolinensis]|nr:hypothetical protein NC651_024249 [Populus alba x Populus x berolinensis]
MQEKEKHPEITTDDSLNSDIERRLTQREKEACLSSMDPGNSSGYWSFLIVYQVAVINGKMIEKSVVEQSAERCSRATKNHGWIN